MTTDGHGIVGYVLSSISLIHGSFAPVISLIVLVMIIYHQFNNRLKREEKITLLLFFHIYLLIFINRTVLISVNIHPLLGDIYGIGFDSSWCIFTGYFIPTTCCALYHSFVIQAFYRLCRIVYFNYRRLQLFWFYVIITPVQVLGASVLMCPALVWHDIIYLSSEYYCLISFTNTRSVFWIVCICYGLPLIYLTLIYIRITLFLRQQPNNLAVAVRRRQQRDLLAIQRIIINVGLLIVLGLPAMVVLAMAVITGTIHPLSHRILWTGIDVPMAILTIEMVFMTPQLKNIVIKRWQQNRVTTIEGSVQMRIVATAQ